MHWSDRLMCRRAFNEPGHAHELTFTCHHRYAFLKAERTCVWLAESLSRARVKYDFSLWAYVFMPEHVHLLIHPRRPDYDIRAILKAVKQPVGDRARVPSCICAACPAWLERITVQHGGRTARHGDFGNRSAASSAIPADESSDRRSRAAMREDEHDGKREVATKTRPLGLA